MLNNMESSNRKPLGRVAGSANAQCETAKLCHFREQGLVLMLCSHAATNQKTQTQLPGIVMGHPEDRFLPRSHAVRPPPPPCSVPYKHNVFTKQG